MKEKRLIEIDFLRGLAIILMIFYHLFFDINFLEILSLPFVESLGWNIYRDIIAISFLLLVGISLNLSFNKTKNTLNKNQIYFKYIKRGLKIFSWGLIITLFTSIFIGQGYVIMGILHLIGISIILSIPFLLTNKNYSLIFGIIVLLIGIFLQFQTCSYNFLIPLGCPTSNFYTIDYFPIFPWFGVILLGLFLGKTFYKENISKFSHVIPVKAGIHTLGKYSLIIYLLHQPIIIGILLLLK